MTDPNPDDVERVAIAIHNEWMVGQYDAPTWSQLIASGHQGSHRVRDTRNYARAAIAAMPGCSRADTMDPEELVNYVRNNIILGIDMDGWSGRDRRLHQLFQPLSQPPEPTDE